MAREPELGFEQSTRPSRAPASGPESFHGKLMMGHIDLLPIIHPETIHFLCCTLDRLFNIRNPSILVVTVEEIMAICGS